MKIAGLVRRLGQPGGAEESMRTLFEDLAVNHEAILFGHANQEVGHDNAVTQRVFTADTNLSPIFRLPAMYLEFYLRFKRELKQFRPSIIFAQHELALLGARQNAPQVLFLRDESLLYSKPSKHNTEGRVANQAVSAAQQRLYGEVIHGSDLVIANSEHTAEKYVQQWNISPEVVYPFVNVSEFKVETTGEKILHVNPSMNKGIDVTLKVADHLQEKDFLVVGRKPSSDILKCIRDRPNVEYWGYVDDMRDVYRQTKLLLMPSRWEEPFGRIPIESGISGIPALCSGSGGLKEAVGDDDLIVDSNEPEAYVQAIKSVLSDYETYATRVHQNAVAKSAPKQLENLRHIIREQLSIKI